MLRSDRILIATLCLIIAASLPIPVFAAAEAGITPDNRYYFLDSLLEWVEISLTFNPEKRAEKALRNAEEKAAEVNAMLARNVFTNISSAMILYERNIGIANTEITKIQDKERKEIITKKISENVTTYTTTLKDVLGITVDIQGAPEKSDEISSATDGNGEIAEEEKDEEIIQPSVSSMQKPIPDEEPATKKIETKTLQSIRQEIETRITTQLAQDEIIPTRTSVPTQITLPSPSLTVTANPTSLTPGEQSVITWNSSNTRSCALKTNTDNISLSETIGSRVITPANIGRISYTITCLGGKESITKEAAITVTAALVPKPTVFLSVEPIVISTGGSVLLSWNSLDASSCILKDATKNLTIASVPQNGSRLVTPQGEGNFSYTITCTGEGGTTSATPRTITANPVLAEVTTVIETEPTPAPSTSLPPSASLSANPNTAFGGEPIVLSWTATNVAECTLRDNTRSIELKKGGPIGSHATILPKGYSSVWYHLFCSGEYGNSASGTVVPVKNLPPTPTASLSANPATLTIGQSSILSWSSTNATSCTLKKGTATLISGNAVGSYTVTPSAEGSSTYTVACTGDGGTISNTATVAVNPVPTCSDGTLYNQCSTVKPKYCSNGSLVDKASQCGCPSGYFMVSGDSCAIPAPVVSLSANPTSVILGNSSVLSWSATNATECSLLSVTRAVNGSQTVTPSTTGTKNYTTTCTGAGGTASKTVSVTVNPTPVATPTPTASLSANPATLTIGQSSILSWSSTNATACTLKKGTATLTSGNAVGSYTVTPSAEGSNSYAITCTGAGGTASGTATVAVNPVPADITPPIISSVSASTITQTGATITWTTNESSDSQVEFGKTTLYGFSSTLNTQPLTAHSVNLTGLTADTTYYYRVKSRDAAGNLATSISKSFTTLAPPSCADGTLYNQCSTAKPKYCSSGSLIDKASQCGCQSGYVVSGDSCATPAPIVSLSANPTSVTIGQSLILSWSSTNATACTLKKGTATLISGNAVGSYTVTPSAEGSSTYTITCTGEGGTASNTTTITANAAQQVAYSPQLSSNPLYNILVVLLNFQDSPTPPFSKEQAESLFFDGQAQKLYQEQSYGKATLGGSVLGWHTLSREGDPGGTCTRPTSGEIEIQNLIVNSGINLSNYRHLVLVYDHPCMGSFGGGANGIQQLQIKGVLYQLSQVFIYARNSSIFFETPFRWTGFDNTFAHELGHALGLNHAELWDCDAGSTFGAGKNCSEISYGNNFDLMGHGLFSLHFNAILKESLNWLDSSSLLAINSSGRYTLSPYEGSSGFRAAKIKVLGSEDYPFYLEYRQPLGFDARLSDPLVISNTRGLFVNWKIGVEETIGLATSRYISSLLDFSSQSDDFADSMDVTLNVGQHFTIPGSGITIGPVIRADASGIMFDVTLEETPCTHNLLDNPRTFLSSMNPGESGYIGEAIIFYNEDSLTCSPSDFKVTLVMPQGWLWVNESANQFTLAPGASFVTAYFIAVPQDITAGSYPVEVNITNLTTGTSRQLGTIIVTIPQITYNDSERRVSYYSFLQSDFMTAAAVNIIGRIEEILKELGFWQRENI